MTRSGLIQTRPPTDHVWAVITSWGSMVLRREVSQVPQGQETRHQADTSGRGANRRAAFRIELTCPVFVFADGSAPGTESWTLNRLTSGFCLATVTEDVSMGGVRLRVPAPLEAGTRLGLTIDVAGNGAEAIGEVMHSRSDEFSAFAGVAFTMIDPQTRAQLTRLIAAEERRRLPNVRVMYPATCIVGGESEAWECSTQECTPAFIRVLIRRPIAPTKDVSVTIEKTGTRIRLDGHVVTCQPVRDLWSIGVQLDSTDALIAASWTDLLTHQRATR